ncbi:MAG: hypothetical protein FD180_2433 [Planctomycetota bacterium]|nr:MAG: hypothetical protein FD180_2433 [Planctomycetota bacterium]
MTTHIDGAPYDELLTEKGGGGWPFVAVLDADGTLLARHGYDRPFTVAGYTQTIEEGIELRAKRRKGENYDKAAAYDWLLAQLSFGSLKLDEAKKKVTALGKLTPEKQAALDPLIANLEVALIEKEQAVALGKKFFDLKKAGKIPSDDGTRSRFWDAILDYAEDQKDAALYEEALKGSREAMEKAQPDLAEFMDRLFEGKERTLKKLKAGGK